ncbi:MAG: O-antigen ligase family protein, partial [Acidimicrobiales bacterium]
AAQRDRVALVLLVALVVLFPISTAKVVLTTPSAVDDLLRRTAIHAFDPVLVAISVLAIGRWIRADRPPPQGLVPRAACATGVLLVIAFAFHPSSHGLEVLLRVGATAAVATEVARLTGSNRQLLLGAVYALGVGEAILSILQVWNGGTLTHGPLEMARFPVFHFGSAVAGQGSFSHPYHLACVLLVALGAGLIGLRAASPRRRWVWWAGLPVVGAALGMSFSRTCLAVIVVALVVVVVFRPVGNGRRVMVVAGSLVAVGFLVGGYVGLDGWRYKERISANAESFDSSRGTVAGVARDLIVEHPLVGVGPGRYVQTVIDEHSSAYHLPPHDLFLQVAAEDGVLAAVMVLALAVGIGVRLLRAGPETLAAFVLLAPFFLFDAFPYVYPHGLVITGLWLGFLHRSDHSAGRKLSWQRGGSRSSTDRKGASFRTAVGSGSTRAGSSDACARSWVTPSRV